MGVTLRTRATAAAKKARLPVAVAAVVAELPSPVAAARPCRGPDRPPVATGPRHRPGPHRERSREQKTRDSQGTTTRSAPGTHTGEGAAAAVAVVVAAVAVGAALRPSVVVIVDAAAAVAVAAEETSLVASISRHRRLFRVLELTLLSPTDQRAAAAPSRIIAMENALEKDMKKVLEDDELGMRKLQVSVRPPPRPAFGTKGAQALFWANYVDITKTRDVDISRYDVSVTPKVEGGKLRQVFRLFLQDARFNDFRDSIASDLHGILITCKKLPKEEFKFDITYKGEKEDTPAENATLYEVRGKLSQTYRLESLIQYLAGSTGPAASLPMKDDIVQAVQILIGNFSKMHKSLVASGNKIFPIEDVQAQTDLVYGLKTIRGYFFSVRPATGRLLLNVNVANGAFYNDGTVPFDDYPLHPGDRSLETLIRKRWSLIPEDDLRRLNSFLYKLKVTTTHLKKQFNKSGQEIPMVKVIQGLADPRDGWKKKGKEWEKAMENPPQVPEFGAKADRVRFYMESQKRYVTVQEFFKKSKFFLKFVKCALNHCS